MASYVAADRHDRWKAIVAVVLVHVLLAVVILSGLNVRLVSQAVERLKTFNIEQPPPPPPVPPPPAPRHEAAKKPEGAAAKMAEPTPVVAPPTPLPVQPSLPAAKVAGTGTAASSGAAASGSGTGAGGSGSGTGGGGTAGYTPARKITKIPDREYRKLADTGIARGSVSITILINPDGRPSNCRIARSSGSGLADALMCRLTLQFVRFSPARDASGRAISQEVTWAPNWAPGQR
jgi:protein TonB